MTTAFASAATGYRSLSERLADVGNTLPEAFGSGKLADRLTETLDKLRDWTGQASQTADQLADVCDSQAAADELLAAAPTEEEVEAAHKALLDGQKALAAGEIEPSELDALRDEYQRLKAERDAALKAHAEACGETEGDLPLCECPCICGEAHDEESDHNSGDREGDDQGAGNGDASTSPSTAGGSSDMGGLSDTAAGTSLTSDTAPMTGTGQPQMLAQQPMAQQAPQPAPSGGGAAPAGGMPQGTMLDKRNPDARLARNAKDDRKKDGLKPSDLDALLAVPAPSMGSPVGGGTGGAPDRGGSSGPVTTDRQIDGKGVNQSTNLSGNLAPNPNNPNANSQAGQGMRGGMMPMGGMGAGAGSLNGAMASKPNIINTQPDPVLREQDDQAVQGGALGRDTSDLPSKVEDEERKK